MGIFRAVSENQAEGYLREAFFTTACHGLIVLQVEIRFYGTL
jgi:hypothetical protein